MKTAKDWINQYYPDIWDLFELGKANEMGLCQMIEAYAKEYHRAKCEEVVKNIKWNHLEDLLIDLEGLESYEQYCDFIVWLKNKLKSE